MHRTLFTAIMIFICVAQGEAAEQARPNILFILADDLGYGDLGCYGCPDIRTPHLDRLADEGIRFTDFYANGSVCSPTRAAFMTGRYQHRIGMEHAVYYQERGKGLPPEEKTIADELKAAGYVTGLAGKWHLGYDFDRRPTQQGFDHFLGLLGGNHHYFEHMDRIGTHDLWLNNAPIKRDGVYTTDLITEDAMRFLEKNRDKPFFLYLSHPAPHFPWQGPGDAGKRVEPKKPSWQQGERKTYVTMVEHMDQRIGDVLAKLDKLGLRENTLVVFTSDNGGHTLSRNAPLRDFKGTRWEGGTRVPCMVRWPAVIKPGIESKQVGITMDWTATFRRVAGLAVDTVAGDGLSLLPLLRSPNEIRERTIFWRRRPSARRKKVRAGRAVRMGNWKLISYDDGEQHLFNLDNDPSETSNLADQAPERVEQLLSAIDEWEQGVDSDTPSPIQR
ncbi:MAG: sulfatase [Rubripirellula sp.]